MPLPGNVNYGTVTWKTISAVGDSTDDTDHDPDLAVVADLKVVFTAGLNPPRVKNPTAVPPVTITLEPVNCTIGSDPTVPSKYGFLLDPTGNRDVRLVASSDPDLIPTGWTWTATVSAPTVPRYSMTFSLAPDQTVDLTTVVEVPASPGTQLQQWLAAVAQVEAIRDELLDMGGITPGELHDLLEDVSVGGALGGSLLNPSINSSTFDNFNAGRINDENSAMHAALLDFIAAHGGGGVTPVTYGSGSYGSGTYGG